MEASLEYKRNKNIVLDNQAREVLIQGVDLLANTVGVTLGPCGQNVIIEQLNGPPVITKDGVTVAQHINLKDPGLDAGVQVVKEVSSRTNETAGDGTTTATVLAQALLHKGQKHIKAGISTIELKNGMIAAKNKIHDELIKMASPVECDNDIENIAKISANGDSNVAKILTQAVNAVGKKGIITVDEARGWNTHLEIVHGMRLKRGYTTPYFVTNHDKMEAILENPYVYVSDKKINTMEQILPLMEAIQKTGKPLLIIADEVEGEALKMLTVNKMRNVLQSCVIPAPARGQFRVELLQDIQTLTGGEYFTEASSIGNKIDISQLGKLKRAIISREGSVLVGYDSSKDDLNKRLNEVNELLAMPNNDEIQVLHLNHRKELLSGTAAVIHVGGISDVELFELKDRVEDALNSVLAAADEGFIPGGGYALWKLSKELKNKNEKLSDDAKIGWNIVMDACCVPLYKIVQNAGLNAEFVEYKLLNEFKTKNNFGLNVKTGEYCDLLSDGVIDPVKVTKTALENAVSVTSTLLSVGAAITFDE